MSNKSKNKTIKIKKTDIKQLTVWSVTFIVSVIIIFAGNRFAAKELSLFAYEENENVKAKVIEINDKTSETTSYGGDAEFTYTEIMFTAQDKDGNKLNCTQTIDTMYAESSYMKEVEVGDNVLVYKADTYSFEESQWYLTDYYRIDKIIVLGAIFFILIIFIGRGKGFSAIVSLSLTFLFVFLVFVPLVMNGYNAYIASSFTCAYTIIMTLLLVNGADKKTLATIIGCFSGSIISAFITAIMSAALRLTGYVDEHSLYLSMLNPDKPIDLTAIIFAGIIIGAIGAIMDVAMDISTSLYEVTRHVPDISFKKLFKSGINIGRDIMGTMANTLVLAYIGSSLSSIMLLLTYSDSLMHLLNREVIIIELLQSLTGSLSILLTIPLTVLICGVLYIKKER